MTDYKALSRRWLQDGYGRGDMSAMEALMPMAMLEETLLREQIRASRKAFPDLSVTIEEQIAEGSRVMTRFTYRGTQTGHLVGIPPTGKSIELTVIELHTWNAGQIAEWWSDFHAVLIGEQLGLISAQA